MPGARDGAQTKTHFSTAKLQDALDRLNAGDSQATIAQTYGVDQATISRLQRNVA